MIDYTCAEFSNISDLFCIKRFNSFLDLLRLPVERVIFKLALFSSEFGFSRYAKIRSNPKRNRQVRKVTSVSEAARLTKTHCEVTTVGTKVLTKLHFCRHS